MRIKMPDYSCNSKESKTSHFNWATQKWFRYLSLSFRHKMKLFIPANCHSFIFSVPFNDMPTRPHIRKHNTSVVVYEYCRMHHITRLLQLYYSMASRFYNKNCFWTIIPNYTPVQTASIQFYCAWLILVKATTNKTAQLDTQNYKANQ